MLAALAPTSGGYRLLLLLHLIAVVVGYGSSFVWPLLGREAGKRRGQAAAVLSEVSVATARNLTSIPIIIAGGLGLLLAILGDRMDEAWTGISLGVFVAGVVMALLVHQPNLRRMDELVHELAAGPSPGGGTGGPPPEALELETRAKAAARNGGVLHLIFLALMVLMIWQPGAN